MELPGSCLIISGGRGIYGLPNEILFLGQARPLGVHVFILAIVAIISHYILAHTRFGHHTLALGDDEAALRQRESTSAASGCCFICSPVWWQESLDWFYSSVNTGDPTAGLNYEAGDYSCDHWWNQSFGRGSILGTMIGASHHGSPPKWIKSIGSPSLLSPNGDWIVLIAAFGWIRSAIEGDHDGAADNERS